MPIGRATAQPRVNIANANSTESSASPYSSVRVQRNSSEINEENGTMGHHQTKMQQNNRVKTFKRNLFLFSINFAVK